MPLLIDFLVNFLANIVFVECVFVFRQVLFYFFLQYLKTLSLHPFSFRLNCQLYRVWINWLCNRFSLIPRATMHGLFIMDFHFLFLISVLIQEFESAVGINLILRLKNLKVVVCLDIDSCLLSFNNTLSPHFDNVIINQLIMSKIYNYFIF